MPWRRGTLSPKGEGNGWRNETKSPQSLGIQKGCCIPGQATKPPLASYLPLQNGLRKPETPSQARELRVLIFVQVSLGALPLQQTDVVCVLALSLTSWVVPSKPHSQILSVLEHKTP